MAFLLVMLALALANAVYVFTFAGKELRREQERAARMQEEPGARPLPGQNLPRHRWGPAPSWTGEVRVARAQGGGHDVTITAVSRGTENIALTSFDVKLTRPGASAALPAVFTQESPNRLKAHVDFPETGEWQISVRLHRERATLSFTQRITIE